MNTNFQGKKTPKENFPCKCLSLIMLHCVIKTNNKYYPQTLLEECKYEIKKIKMENLINDDLDSSSSDESDNESDNDRSNDKSDDKSDDKSGDKSDDKSNNDSSHESDNESEMPSKNSSKKFWSGQ